MKAIGLYHYLPIEDPQSLIDLEIETPVPGACQLLVRVKAIAVNPVDVKARAQKAQAETTPRILGWDVAGIVEAVGLDCTLFEPGDAVYYAGDWLHPGANSELHLVDEHIVGRKPKNLDFAQAAALPLTTITAWEGLFDRLLITPPTRKESGEKHLDHQRSWWRRVYGNTACPLGRADGHWNSFPPSIHAMGERAWS